MVFSSSVRYSIARLGSEFMFLKASLWNFRKSSRPRLVILSYVFSKVDSCLIRCSFRHTRSTLFRLAGKDYFGCLLPQQIPVCSTAPFPSFDVNRYPHCACCSAIDAQAKRQRRSMGSEQYANYINELETQPLQPCEELLNKFPSRSMYNWLPFRAVSKHSTFSRDEFDLFSSRAFLYHILRATGHLADRVFSIKTADSFASLSPEAIDRCTCHCKEMVREGGSWPRFRAFSEKRMWEAVSAKCFSCAGWVPLLRLLSSCASADLWLKMLILSQPGAFVCSFENMKFLCHPVKRSLCVLIRGESLQFFRLSCLCDFVWCARNGSPFFEMPSGSRSRLIPTYPRQEQYW